MIYISKGIVIGKSSFGLYIRHFGQPMEILGEEARMWYAGRFGFSYADTDDEFDSGRNLAKKRLIITEERDGDFEKYHALCRCAICANPKTVFRPAFFNETEKNILIWLREVGANLSLPELVFLNDGKIKPTPELLYKKNAVKLLKIIYPWSVSMAGELESKMKHSIARKRTVDAVLGLLRKRRVVIM